MDKQNISFRERLQNASSLDMRMEIIKEKLDKKEIMSIEEGNGGKILDLKEMLGLKVGDKVLYTNVLHKQAEGCIVFFFQYESGKVEPIIYTDGYSTHHEGPIKVINDSN